CQKYISSPFIF
nr:immunoglobulin light chain junction region [Macaca mulatta]